MRTETTTKNFGLIFLIAAILILVFALDVVWWAAILVAFLARTDFKIETVNRYRL